MSDVSELGAGVAIRRCDRSYFCTLQVRLTVPAVARVLRSAEYQITLAPVALLRQKTSDLWSPLKSPLAATCQCGSVTPGRTCRAATLADGQSEFAPVMLFRQK